MQLLKLPMGCLSSRSTIAPTSAQIKSTSTTATTTDRKSEQQLHQQPNEQSQVAKLGEPAGGSMDQRKNLKEAKEYLSSYSSNVEQSNSTLKKKMDDTNMESTDDEIKSILIIDQSKSSTQRLDNLSREKTRTSDREEMLNHGKLVDEVEGITDKPNEGRRAKDDVDETMRQLAVVSGADAENETAAGASSAAGNGPLNEEEDLDLLRQYMAIDYEINSLEDKDALRVYHEKIEQLEQLERELDLISSEAEEVATRSEKNEQRMKRIESIGGSKLDTTENNSIISGPTGSLSHRSWLPDELQAGEVAALTSDARKTTSKTVEENLLPESIREGERGSIGGRTIAGKGGGSKKEVGTSSTLNSQATGRGGRQMNNLPPYFTVEEVFNRKIILEKERDKLKKEVEMVIVECDKLQQRYKKRDEILDKLFDGRTGNGLENHLEQQLNWLLEQKHYVDQVFYVWKRAETLTSQTCEQFASALELLKRLPTVDEPGERGELVKSIGSLLVESRQGMEQAQKYNPSVDTPFFTDNETERFDNIIEKITSNSISQSEYSQILTVIQFAYKRAVSIRLWLEQILQTTIARDSFELAEEYKWIAIQLRKERINLIKAKLQYSPYRSMAQELHEQMARQQSLLSEKQRQQQQQHEVNRDSGIESETNDIEIEEEIYRLLELNKSRLEMTAATGTPSVQRVNDPIETAIEQYKSSSSSIVMSNRAEPTNSQPARALMNQQQQQLSTKDQKMAPTISASSSESHHRRDQQMRDRIQKRARGELQLNKMPLTAHAADNYIEDLNVTSKQGSAGSISNSVLHSEASNNSMGTPTRLRVELDEAAKQNLLKQVDQIHSKHKSRIERLRGNNRVKATNSIMNRMQNVRETQHKPAKT